MHLSSKVGLVLLQVPESIVAFPWLALNGCNGHPGVSHWIKRPHTLGHHRGQGALVDQVGHHGRITKIKDLSILPQGLGIAKVGIIRSDGLRIALRFFDCGPRC